MLSMLEIPGHPAYQYVDATSFNDLEIVVIAVFSLISFIAVQNCPVGKILDNLSFFYCLNAKLVQIRVVESISGHTTRAHRPRPQTFRDRQ